MFFALALLLALLQTEPPTSLWAVPIDGGTVALSSTGSGERLAAEDFGTLPAVPAGGTKAIVFSVSFTNAVTVTGMRIVIQPGDNGEFAILAPEGNSLPLGIAAGGTLPLGVEFRPKTAGIHLAEIVIDGAAGPLARFAITGNAQ